MFFNWIGPQDPNWSPTTCKHIVHPYQTSGTPVKLLRLITHSRRLPLTFRAKYQEPTVAEGFAEVVRVNFVPEFRSEEEQALYAMYLVEKWVVRWLIKKLRWMIRKLGWMIKKLRWIIEKSEVQLKTPPRDHGPLLISRWTRYRTTLLLSVNHKRRGEGAKGRNVIKCWFHVLIFGDLFIKATRAEQVRALIRVGSH